MGTGTGVQTRVQARVRTCDRTRVDYKCATETGIYAATADASVIDIPTLPMVRLVGVQEKVLIDLDLVLTVFTLGCLGRCQLVPGKPGYHVPKSCLLEHEQS